MATESVATDPEMYGAPPMLGNYTGDADMHLWCANALARVVATPDAAFESWNDDIQDAIRYLLSCEVSRAKHAHAGEAAGRKRGCEDEPRSQA